VVVVDIMKRSKEVDRVLVESCKTPTCTGKRLCQNKVFTLDDAVCRGCLAKVNTVSGIVSLLAFEVING
jgi:hypothetical protein